MKKIIAILMVILLFGGCGTGKDPDGETAPVDKSSTVETDLEAGDMEDQGKSITFTDALGRSLSIEKPSRVVAGIGSFADIWCLAGGKDTLVATASDAWTSFDLELEEDVINIGSAKDPSLELLLSAEPDLVIASVNTDADLEWQAPLEAAGIAVAYFDVEHFEDYLAMLQICTELTGYTGNYEVYGQEVRTVVDTAISRQDGSQPRVLYVRASGSGCKVKNSQGNVLGEMLKDLGCVNIADNQESLLEDISLETIMQEDPDYIFLLLQGTDTAEAESVLEETLLSNPAWSTLTAVQKDHVYYMDHTMYNLKPNARWGEAYEKLADILYPETTE